MSANFVPKRRVVTAITRANPAVVTAIGHGYTSGDIVRVNVPLNYGMRLTREALELTVVNVNSFSINEDTVLLDPFVVPAIVPLTVAECLPISAMTNNIAT